MAPALLQSPVNRPSRHMQFSGLRRPGARETQAAWHHGHFGLKPASRGFATGTPAVDFRPGKVGVN